MNNLVKIQSDDKVLAFWIEKDNLPDSLKKMNKEFISIDGERYKNLRIDLWDNIVNRCTYCYYFDVSNVLIPCRKRNPIFSINERNSIGVDCKKFKYKED